MHAGDVGCEEVKCTGLLISANCFTYKSVSDRCRFMYTCMNTQTGQKWLTHAEHADHAMETNEDL